MNLENHMKASFISVSSATWVAYHSHLQQGISEHQGIVA